MKNPHTSFILTAICIHVLLFLAGIYFFGLDYALLLCFFWMLCWVHYCCIVQKTDEDTYNHASYLKLVLVGGIFCWLICPWALVPRKHREHIEPVTWIMLMKIYQAISASIVRAMQIIFSLTQEVQEEIAAKDQEVLDADGHEDE